MLVLTYSETLSQFHAVGFYCITLASQGIISNQIFMSLLSAALDA